MPVFRRWQLYDPVLDDTYAFEVGPNTGGSPQRTRTITVTPTTASDGVSLYFQGQETVPTIEFKGTGLSKAQYEAFITWFTKKYLVLLTDDFNRQMQVYLESFEPVRAPLSHHPWRFTYTAKARVFDTVYP
jgi:hypothetical protein